MSQPPVPTPEPLLQLQFAHAASRVLAVGVQLAVFTHVAEGKKTAAEVARAAGANERGTRMLLDALVAFQLLAKEKGRYELTPLSGEYLVRGRPSYMGQLLEVDSMWEVWTHLPEVVLTGKPVHRVEEEGTAEKFFSVLIRALHVLNREPARRAAQALGAWLAARKDPRVLDVACGSGVWSIPLLEANAAARATAQDFPGVLETTREFLGRHGVLERFDFLPGDLKAVDYGRDRYDLAILGNIVHSEGEPSSRALFRKLHGALRSGGRIAIVDMIPNDERTGPPFPVIFALNMLLQTEEGDTYTLAELRRWLEDAGFGRVETVDIASHSPLVVATK